MNKTIIKGKYNEAIVYTDNMDDDTVKQIETLLDQEFLKDSKIRIMPDVHLGVGCTIGTTMTVNDKVVPNLVGVDIGCGMEVIKIKNTYIELEKLDKLIYNKIPAGFKIRDKEHRFNSEIDLEKLRCKKHVNLDRAKKSIGTLGGGNHFIEANKDEEGNIYIVLHSGSRHLGLQIANYYQKVAHKSLPPELKSQIPKSLAYLTGDLFDDYIHDMEIAQQYAVVNRRAMMDEIIKGMKLDVVERFTTIHNYIDTESMILRKGAVSAKAGEKFILPINMKDGSIICEGKGNPEWNYSAPHGAGRIMSRKEAKSTFTLSEFKKSMENVYTTSVSKKTLDECPQVYKPMEEILENIHETAKILHHIKPIYNFKAAD